jgi:hypothetical protein
MTFHPVAVPSLINMEKLQRPCISVFHLAHTHVKISWPAVYREHNCHAADMRRYMNTATSQQHTCLDIDEEACLNLSATNVCQERNKTEATVPHICRSS